jgi:hypothetical protein
LSCSAGTGSTSWVVINHNGPSGSKIETLDVTAPKDTIVTFEHRAANNVTRTVTNTLLSGPTTAVLPASVTLPTNGSDNSSIPSKSILTGPASGTATASYQIKLETSENGNTRLELRESPARRRPSLRRHR